MDICILTSGSCGNCTLVRSGETSVLIDVGLSKRYLTNALKSFSMSIDEIGALLLTHEHSDHVRGLQDIANVNNLPVYTTHGTWNNIRLNHEKRIPENQNLFSPGSAMKFKDLYIETFSLSHDATEPVGFRVTDEYGFSVAIATDTGIVTSEIASGIKGANVIILESNYDEDMLVKGKYPYYLKKRIAGSKGHLSNTECGASLSDAITDATEYICLAHMSKDNNDPLLAHKTVFNMLNDTGIKVDVDVELKLSHRYMVADPIHIGSTEQRRLFI